MNYSLVHELLDLVELFDNEQIKKTGYTDDIEGFRQWMVENYPNIKDTDPEWEGKASGRSPDSVINTLIVHLNRYAKTYSKSAIYNSGFSTQEEFIYLINLKSFGAMTKMQLIKKNIQEKPAGMQIINRLIKQGWVEQITSKDDKRSKVISITGTGLMALEQQMGKIRQATQIVTGNLTSSEKMELIRLLSKLDHFHKPIYHQNLSPKELLDTVSENYLIHRN